jgi:hypothetical protein
MQSAEGSNPRVRQVSHDATRKAAIEPNEKRIAEILQAIDSLATLRASILADHPVERSASTTSLLN